MVVADSVEFARLSVQEKALLRDELHSTDSETGLIHIRKTLSIVNLRHGPVEERGLRRPELRIFHYEILHQGLSRTCLACKGLHSGELAVRGIYGGGYLQSCTFPTFHFRFKMH